MKIDSIGKAGLTALVVVAVLAGLLMPLVLIAGMNFLLEAAQYPELPYTLETWFGALLISVALSVGRSSG